jgi:hypothetical protein
MCLDIKSPARPGFEPRWPAWRSRSLPLSHACQTILYRILYDNHTICQSIFPSHSIEENFLYMLPILGSTAVKDCHGCDKTVTRWARGNRVHYFTRNVTCCVYTMLLRREEGRPGQMGNLSRGICRVHFHDVHLVRARHISHATSLAAGLSHTRYLFCLFVCFFSGDT